MHVSVNTAVVSKMEMTIDEQYALIAKAGFTAIDMGMSGSINTKNTDSECRCILKSLLKKLRNTTRSILPPSVSTVCLSPRDTQCNLLMQ